MFFVVLVYDISLNMISEDYLLKNIIIRQEIYGLSSQFMMDKYNEKQRIMENLTYSYIVSERAISQIHVIWSKYLFPVKAILIGYS